jgi:hypothetical protein
MSLECKRCGCTGLYIAPGTGPHFKSLRCAECGSFFQWISRARYDEFKSRYMESGVLPDELQTNLFDFLT